MAHKNKAAALTIALMMVLPAAARAATILPVPANATVAQFQFTQTDVSGFGAGVFGALTATQVGGDVHVAVQLADGYQFRYAPDSNHHALAFDLGSTSHAITGLEPTVFHRDAGSSFTAAGLGAWDYAIDCARGASGRNKTACQSGWSALNPTSLAFNIVGAKLSDFRSSVERSGQNIYFVADVVDSKGRTGNVGAVYAGAVPEPSTWAMMMVGLVAVRLGLQRRKRAATAAVAV